MDVDAVFVGVDIGSVNRPGGFSWVMVAADGSLLDEGADDPSALVDAAGGQLTRGTSVAIAFECPLSVPVPGTGALEKSADQPVYRALGKARDGEGNRPWSAGAGAGALATGLAQAAWVCRALRDRMPGLSATSQTGEFRSGGRRLLLAESMVSVAGKPQIVDGCQDRADAQAAAALLRQMVLADARSDVTCAPHRPLNLAVVVALHAGLDIDPAELALDVLVARVRPVPIGGAGPTPG